MLKSTMPVVVFIRFYGNERRVTRTYIRDMLLNDVVHGGRREVTSFRRGIIGSEDALARDQKPPRLGPRDLPLYRNDKYSLRYHFESEELCNQCIVDGVLATPCRRPTMRFRALPSFRS
jgi:hypothetical protein